MLTCQRRVEVPALARRGWRIRDVGRLFPGFRFGQNLTPNPRQTSLQAHLLPWRSGGKQALADEG